MHHGLNYFIRINNNVISSNAKGLEIEISGLFYDLKLGETRALCGKRKLWKQRVYLAGTMTHKGELLNSSQQP